MIKYPPFISIEGVDKAGKTTLINLLNKYQDLIHWTGKRIVFTREPGGFDNPKAEKLRTFILGNEFDVITQTYLFAASRNEHVINTIRPNLSVGNIVITDRYIDSSFVYQGIIGNLGIDAVKEINKYAIHDIMPTITIVLVISPQESVKRLKEVTDPKEINVFDEKVYLINADKIHEGFISLKKQFPERIHLIDGTSNPKDILLNVVKIINDYIEQHYE